MEVKCPNKKCNMMFTLSLEEVDSILIPKNEAIALYELLQHEFLNRDNYEILKRAMETLRRAVA